MAIQSVRYVSADTGVADIEYESGWQSSRRLPDKEIDAWIAAGNSIVPYVSPSPPTADQALVAWKRNPVNDAVLKLLAADSGRTDKQIDDAIKANL